MISHARIGSHPGAALSKVHVCFNAPFVKVHAATTVRPYHPLTMIGEGVFPSRKATPAVKRSERPPVLSLPQLPPTPPQPSKG